MAGLDSNLIAHNLNVSPEYQLVKQRRRNFSEGVELAIKEEVEKLLKANFIRPIQHPTCWGLDIIGLINPTLSLRHKYIITATEYSTKWVEVIPLRDYSGATIAAFIKENIICRFGAPMIIRSDNGTSFVNQTVIDLLDQYGIKFHTSTVYYPQGNGQAEATNKTLLRILRRMSICTPGHLRRPKDERFADKYRQWTARYYNQKVKERVFSVNDVVMKIVPHVQRNEKAGKFAANWQGPYMISEAAESGYYYLKRMNDSCIDNPINGKWLKTYYA
ncbi:uncharacterized protein LOC113305680 [Papaver somniferum]|uniref:uncharacterized protein LOC113305680 n=1 Tax=Papaver somniferum TaxID=3469 RepID=UPI000E6FF60B|nr:uncharacterized protein LOC113305680 [Papaver somniferum]